MEEPLEQLLKRISDDQALYSGIEERTKHAAVFPILNSLQWDCFNTREVIPEFSSGNGRVDYCLHIKNINAVFIEVKRSMEDLEQHEEQLLNYAFHSGIEMAILTNGLIWWFYLPLTDGLWQQRKFFTIDITQQDPKQAAKHFSEFLLKDNIVNGSAMARAMSVKDNKKKQSVVAEFLPIAWDELVQRKDEHLLDLIADRVENLCGYRPEPDDVSKFIDRLAANKTYETILLSKKKQKKYQSKADLTTQKNLEEQSEITELSLEIGNEKIQADSVSDLYNKIIKNLVDSGRIKIAESMIPFATSSKRYLIAKQPYHQNNKPFVVPVNYEGYYLEAHKDRRNGLNHIKKFLHLSGLVS